MVVFGQAVLSMADWIVSSVQLASVLVLPTLRTCGTNGLHTTSVAARAGGVDAATISASATGDTQRMESDMSLLLEPVPAIRQGEERKAVGYSDSVG
jgi:hypothetical protein